MSDAAAGDESGWVKGGLYRSPDDGKLRYFPGVLPAMLYGALWIYAMWWSQIKVGGRIFDIASIYAVLEKGSLS